MTQIHKCACQRTLGKNSYNQKFQANYKKHHVFENPFKNRFQTSCFDGKTWFVCIFINLYDQSHDKSLASGAALYKWWIFKNINSVDSYHSNTRAASVKCDIFYGKNRILR